MTTEITHTLITIPLNRLVMSPKNTRKAGRNSDLHELKASIRAHGLRQCLNVEAGEVGFYGVVAGGRRLKAMKQLVKAKRLPKDFPVPCRILQEGEDATEISLAENVVRTAMHPADQYVAFAAQRDRGYSTDEIAQRFGVEAALVEKRLKLAAVAPQILGAYRRGLLTLEILMAFTVTDDHEAQLRVWKQARKSYLSAQDVRRSLTQGSIPANHRLAQFVGIEAYIAAGGAVVRDLFDTSNTGFLTDSSLLMQLVSQKLAAAEEAVRLEGWKWVKPELEADHATSYRRVYSQQGEDEGRYSAGDLAKAGAILRIAHDGTLDVRRGHVHPDDWKQEEKATKAKPAKPTPEKGEYAAAVVEDLSAHKTAALRSELARNPDVALAATVHAMALGIFERYAAAERGCLDVRAGSERLDGHVKSREDCSAHAAMQAEIARWHAVLPDDGDALFDWCLTQPQAVLLDLLALLAACSVNAVQSKGAAHSSRIAHGEALASALSLDMAQHWSGSEEGFYSRLPKAGLAFVVGEAKAPVAASVFSMKKLEAARYVRQAVEGTGWLPVPLRTAAHLVHADAA